MLTYKDGRGLNLPYADVNYRPNHLRDFRGGTCCTINNPQADTFLLDSNTNSYISERTEGPHYYLKRNGLITLAVYATGYSGNFYPKVV